MIIHTVSGEVRQLPEEEFLALFDTSVHEAIKANAAKEGVEAVICFENLDMWSSQFGLRTAMIVGPSCTYQLATLGPDFRLGDVPSRFQYPTAYWLIGDRK